MTQQDTTAGAGLAWPIKDDGSPALEGITFYGADWCGDCRRAKAVLATLGVEYTQIDTTEAPPEALQFVAAQSAGMGSIPVIVLGQGGPILVEPSNDELTKALADSGFLSR